MPQRKVHNTLNRMLFGRDFNQLNKVLDSAHKVLGTRHRIVFHHPVQAAIVGYSMYGEEGALAALLHSITDEATTRNKYLKHLLEMLSGG